MQFKTKMQGRAWLCATLLLCNFVAGSTLAQDTPAYFLTEPVQPPALREVDNILEREDDLQFQAPAQAQATIQQTSAPLASLPVLTQPAPRVENAAANAAPVNTDMLAVQSAVKGKAVVSNALKTPVKKAKSTTVERISQSDESVRIDELRIAGETRSITVQPLNSNLQPYAVAPERHDQGMAQKDLPKAARTTRTWKMFDF